MKTSAVIAKAKALKIASTNMPKEELIRAIQAKEGNFPCFGTTSGECDQSGCLWRADCVGTAPRTAAQAG